MHSKGDKVTDSVKKMAENARMAFPKASITISTGCFFSFKKIMENITIIAQHATITDAHLLDHTRRESESRESQGQRPSTNYHKPHQPPRQKGHTHHVRTP